MFNSRALLQRGIPEQRAAAVASAARSRYKDPTCGAHLGPVAIWGPKGCT